MPPDAARAALEASLTLRVWVDDGRITGVDVGGERPVRAAGVLEGRPVESALASLPLLYRLCGTAQSVAGLRAVEAAFGCGPGPAGRAARSLLVTLEAFEQTLWRILLDWPPNVGVRADPGALKQFRKRLHGMQRGVFADSTWARIGGATSSSNSGELLAAVAAIAGDVDAVLFGGDRSGDVLQSRRAFEEWLRAGRSTTAAVLGWVTSNRLHAFGGAGIRPESEFDADAIAARMDRDDAWEFCSLPDSDGQVPQTGALARWTQAPLLRELRAEHGCGLLTQLAARLFEVVAFVDALRDAVLALRPEAPARVPPLTDGRGIGCVDTARGRLFHRVDMRDGRVARYRTLAPTEWNFHPRGPLARGLVGAPAGDVATTRRAIALLVNAVDPCVGIALEVSEA